MARFVAGIPPALKLQASSSGRYFVNAAGTPVQLRGDAAWALPVQLTREKVVDYFAKRKAQGFNAALMEIVNVVDGFVKDGATATGDWCSNAYGDLPFIGGDITVPNPPYWDHIDFIQIAAARYGLQALWAALYLGFAGGTEGAYAKAVAAGTTDVQTYAAALAARYAKHHNLLWVNGGDFFPPTLAIPNAVAAGLAGDARHMLSTHWARDSDGTDGGPAWLTCNSEYTHDNNIWSRITAEYAATTNLPILHIESYYEGEHSLVAQDAQREMWAAYLSGAAGHVYGNGGVWSFPTGYESHLTDGGATSMRHLADFFDSIAWQKLVPDSGSAFITAGRGTVDTVTYVTAAKAADGTLGVVYIPGGGQVAAALGGFAGTITATFVDPATGTPTSAGTFSASGSQNFDPAGSADTVLLLTA